MPLLRLKNPQKTPGKFFPPRNTLLENMRSERKTESGVKQNLVLYNINRLSKYLCYALIFSFHTTIRNIQSSQ